MDIKLLPARVADTANICERTCVPKFLGFLTAEECAIALPVLKKLDGKYQFFGGYDDAERQMLCCMPDWCDEPDYPISSLTFTYRTIDSLTHRDFLGSFMALGITRESVGDILVGCGRTVCFFTSDISGHIAKQINKIGKVGVTINEGFELPLPGLGELVDFSSTVSSTRLDCIVAALAGYSRTAATEAIEKGLISVNSVTCEKCTHNIVSSDKITIRGKGKFMITSLDEKTRKGRLVLNYKKYI